MSRLYLFPAMALMLALAGCYISDKPFIAASQADTPYPANATYTKHTISDPDASKDVGGSVTLKNGVYIFHPKSSSDVPASVTFKSIGDGYFIVQEYISPSDVAALKMTDTLAKQMLEAIAGKYLYFVEKIDGTTAYELDIGCDPDGDQKYVKAGLIDHIDKDSSQCFPRDLASLTTVFRDKIKSAKQDSKIIISAN